MRKPPPASDPAPTLAEVAERFSVPVEVIRQLVIDGRVPVLDLGHRHRYIHPHDLPAIARMLKSDGESVA